MSCTNLCDNLLKEDFGFKCCFSGILSLHLLFVYSFLTQDGPYLFVMHILHATHLNESWIGQSFQILYSYKFQKCLLETSKWVATSIPVNLNFFFLNKMTRYKKFNIPSCDPIYSCTNFVSEKLNTISHIYFK